MLWLSNVNIRPCGLRRNWPSADKLSNLLHLLRWGSNIVVTGCYVPHVALTVYDNEIWKVLTKSRICLEQIHSENI